MEYLQKAIKALIENKIRTKQGLTNIKKGIAEKYKIPFPTNIELIKKYREMIKNKEIRACPTIEKILQVRAIRSLSGVVSIALLVSPAPKWGRGKKTCPFNCLFCPIPKDLPKSYLKNEPAVMRAIANNFDPYKQVSTRIKALQSTGHPTDKIELIIIGGSWSYLPKRYQSWFIKRSFDACNEISSKRLEEAQEKNEQANNRIIGITVETRPNYITRKEIKQMRKLGITRIELGVQSIYNKILNLNNRGEGIESTINATKLLKNAGFKVCYHIMPNLYGSNIEMDIQMFKDLFSNPNFQPDYLKIYPCIVVKNSQLYQVWKEGRFKPYTDEELTYLLKTIKQLIPPYCRVIRVVRDIPSTDIVGGSKISNLNQIVLDEMKKEGKECRCIRCREIRKEYHSDIKLKIFRQNYNASDGKEIFLSWEDEERKNIYSLLRLRLPAYAKSSTNKSNQKEKALLPVLQNSALIREIHTYGKVQKIKKREKESPQHKGLGRKLLQEAEKIAKKAGYKKMVIISGVGVRKYYQKLGYHLKETYMVKNLKIKDF